MDFLSSQKVSLVQRANAWNQTSSPSFPRHAQLPLAVLSFHFLPLKLFSHNDSECIEAVRACSRRNFSNWSSRCGKLRSPPYRSMYFDFGAVMDQGLYSYPHFKLDGSFHVAKRMRLKLDANCRIQPRPAPQHQLPKM